jgi:hypothetical protein
LKTEVIISKKENKEKGSVAHAKYSNWPSLSRRGTLNKSFIHRGNERQKTKCEGQQWETHPQIVKGLCHFNPIVPLPSFVNSVKLLD